MTTSRLELARECGKQLTHEDGNIVIDMGEEWQVERENEQKRKDIVSGAFLLAAIYATITPFGFAVLVIVYHCIACLTKDTELKSRLVALFVIVSLLAQAVNDYYKSS